MRGLSGARLLSVATLGSRILGFGKNTVLAAALGTGIVGDAYNVANTIPNIIFTVLAGGILSAVFVPQIVRAFERSTEDGRSYAGRLVGLAVVIVAPVTIALTFASPIVVASAAPADWSSAEFALAATLAYMCLPQVFFYAVYAVLGQALNAQNKFGAMAWAPALNNVIAIAVGSFVIISGSVSPDDVSTVTPTLALVLGLGTTAGVVLQAAVVAIAARAAGIRIHFRSRTSAVPLRKAVSLGKWSLGQLAVTQLATFLVLRAAASTAAPLDASTSISAGFSSFNYAYLVVLLPHAVLAMSVATSSMPLMSQHLVRGRTADYARALRRSLTSIQSLIVPVAGFLALGGVPVAVLLFAYGNTSATDAWYLGLVLSAFALGLLPMSTRSLYLYAMYAAEETKVPFAIASLAAGGYASLAFASAAFLPPFWKLIGVALSLGVSNLLAVGFMRWALRRSGRAPEHTRSSTAWKVVVATIGGLALAQATSLIAGAGWIPELPTANATVTSLLRGLSLTVGMVATIVMCHFLGVSPMRGMKFRRG